MAVNDRSDGSVTRVVVVRASAGERITGARSARAGRPGALKALESARGRLGGASKAATFSMESERARLRGITPNACAHTHQPVALGSSVGTLTARSSNSILKYVDSSVGERLRCVFRSVSSTSNRLSSM